MEEENLKEWAGRYLFTMKSPTEYENDDALRIAAAMAVNLGQAASVESVNLVALRRMAHTVGDAVIREQIFQLVCECAVGEVPRTFCGCLYWRLSRFASAEAKYARK